MKQRLPELTEVKVQALLEQVPCVCGPGLVTLVSPKECNFCTLGEIKLDLDVGISDEECLGLEWECVG